MSSINFEHYKVFYFVAKMKNITSAASALYLSQPSVSRCISNLEEDLNCTLFTRSKKRRGAYIGGRASFQAYTNCLQAYFFG